MSDLHKLIKYTVETTKYSEIMIPVASKMQEKGGRKEAFDIVAKFLTEKEHILTIRSDNGEEVYIYQNGIYVPEGKTYLKEIIKEIFGKAYDKNIANAIIDLISTDTYIDGHKFFNDRRENPYVCLENGLFNLKTGKLEKYNPKYIFFHKFNVFYDENAKIKEIEAFLEDIVEYKEDIFTLQEMFGWLFFKDYKFQKIFLFLGQGGNGKTQVLNLARELLGVDNCGELQPVEMNNGNFDTSDLWDKLANICGDISAESIKDASLLKRLSGGELISAKRKFKSSIKFVNSAKMIFSANELPVNYDMSDGMWRRIILLEFKNRYVDESEYKKLSEPEQTKVRIAKENLLQVMTTKEEMAGLFNWAYEGYLRLKKQNHFTYRLSREQVRSLWLMRSDSFSAYMYSELDLKNIDPDSKISKEDLRREYVAFCRKNNLKAKSDKHVHRILTDEGVSESRILLNETQKYYWVGIKFGKEANNNLGDVSKPVENKYIATAKYNVRNLINTMPKNNETFARKVFGDKLIDNMLEEGELIRVSLDTIILGGK